METLEYAAFSLWKTDAPLSYKRRLVTALYAFIAEERNQTNVKLLYRLNRLNSNVGQADFNDAVASLRSFGVIGTCPVKGDEEKYHVNVKTRKAQLWKRYVEYVAANT
ncbi:hypothetical protein D3C85_1527660 [compost metagenome]